MMKTKNYNDFDIFKIYVKKNKSTEVIENYKSFGYELVEETPNERYEDILNLEFQRPHKIHNKDDLQLLQVYMEENVNDQAKLEKNKHSKSTIFGLCFGSLCLAFILLGAYLVLKIATVIGMIFGIISIVFGIAIGVVTIIVTIEMIKKEKIVFEKKHKEIVANTKSVCLEAEKLLGGKHGKN